MSTRRCLIPLLAAAPMLALAADAIEIDTPRAGWRVAGGDGAAFLQEVHYPAVRVSTPEAQADTARIKGRIAATAKGPAQLVVNGVAMPLAVDDSGGFDRPYLFAPGSNSLEVRDAERSNTRRVQFFQRPNGQTAAKLRVLLAWDSDHTDLDLHVITPDGGHAWYGERVLANGGAIDVDVTTGYGPEIFASPSPLPGSYLVFVNYFGGGYDAWSETYDAVQDLTTAQVTIVSGEGTVDEKQQTVFVPLRQPGELTLVARFSYP